MCTGNICRSPIAERLARAHGNRLQIPDFHTSSAGTRAVIGHPIHESAAAVLTDLGGDASGFAARQLKPKVLTGVDLVLTMTRAHRDAVLELAPQKLRRTFTLREAARLVSECHATTVDDLGRLRSQLAVDKLPDIPDPIGQSADVFAAIGAQIADLLPPILKLCQRTPPAPTR